MRMASSTSDESNHAPASSSTSQPRQDQHSAVPPPFLTKTCDMIDDSSTDLVVSWSTKGTSFVVWNPPEFARDLLPKYFKHNNFSSFVRQLNTYGFRKVDPDRWEFANEGFVRGHRHLLKGIHRRKPHQNQEPSTASNAGKGSLETEFERLNRDKSVLMLELVRLRQQQQQTERELQLMGQRLHATERRQQLMIDFLAKAIQSPGFLAHILRGGGNSGSSSITGQKRKQLDVMPAVDGDDEEYSGRIVRFNPDSGAREKLIRFFSRPEVIAKLEDSPVQVEVLVRELLEAEEDEQTVTTDNKSGQENEGQASTRQPTVTTPCSEISSLEDNRQFSPRSPSDAASNHHDMQLQASSAQVRKTTVHASVDSGAVGVGFNDVFWERFLTDSTATRD